MVMVGLILILGSSGHLISNTVKESLAESFSKREYYDIDYEINCSRLYNKLSANSYSLIKSTFSKLDEEITNSKIDVKYSGSTANFILILEKRLLCVNCGDSRAIIIQKIEDKNTAIAMKQNIISTEFDWTAIALSKDHKPDVEEEKARIITNNGRIEKYKDNQGPFRVWLKNEETPGLAMSRSLGDSLAKTVGVISEPGKKFINIKEIKECEINDNSLFVVIASDGIWEFLSNEEVSKIVMPYYIKNDINGALASLVEEAEQIWRQVHFYLKKGRRCNR
jgi:serine/threonine protein phosphatase PrpC